jgi:multidrug efflux system outer membrane protein
MRKYPHPRSLGAACPGAFLTALLLAGCTVGPDYRRPDVTAPPAWRLGATSASETPDAAWWEQFGDPALTRLIRAALADSYDLKAAAARVDQALALYGAARAGLFPQVNADASAVRSRASRNTLQGQAIPAGHQVYGALDLDLSASYEIDLWGRVRRATEAARAGLLASEEARRTVVMTLVSSVAEAYIELRALDEQLEIGRRTLDSRREALRLQKARFEGGVAAETDLRQAESQFESAASVLPQVERAIGQQENLIKVLVGADPGAVERGLPIGQLQFPAIPAGLPADLLQRRPDLRQAEQELVAANADIGVARAAYFPRIALTGLLGVQSAQLSNLFNDASVAWSVGAGAVQPLIDGGAIASQVRLAEARQREALYSYRRAVIGAFQEVEDALIARSTLERQRAEEAKNVAALRRFRDLAESRYREGATIYLEVATAEQSLFDAELALSAVQAQLFQSYANLYKALGGGWVDRAAAQADAGAAALSDADPAAPRGIAR